MSKPRNAFTLVELLVVVAIIGIIIAIVLPTLSSARESSRAAVCAANLKSQGAALRAFLNDSDERLPQVWIDRPTSPVSIVAPSPTAIHVGQLFMGVTGDLPFFGIDEIGAERRPLNPYLGVQNPPSDVSQAGLHGEEKFRMPVAHCPSDQGISDPVIDMMLPPDAEDAKESAYELLGTSYVLNDHALDPLSPSPQAPEIATLVPVFESGFRARDGRMPEVATPGLTWVIGDQPIYNYDRGNDRKVHWHFKGVNANLLFVDLHVGVRMHVPAPDPTDPFVRETQNTTSDYTFLPDPTWPIVPPGQP